VLVGDAAVTPHPGTGSGIETGFRGFEVLVELFEMLEKASKAENRAQAFMSFNQHFEFVASEKALEGTVQVCQNLKTTLDTFLDGYTPRKLSSQGSSSGPDPLVKKLTVLKEILDHHIKVAKGHLDLIKPGKGGGEPRLPGEDAVSNLWEEIGRTYSIIKELTGAINTLNERMRKLEAELR
jgi:hypothetical protein